MKTIAALVGCARVWRDINGQAAAVLFNPMPLRQADLVFVSGSETYPDEGWDNATDGDVAGWDGTVTTTGDSAFAVFAFNATERVTKVRLCTDTGVGFGSRWVKRFQILVSTTGTAEGDFTPVLASELNGGGWRQFEFLPAAAKYVKLRIEIPASGWRQLGEFEVHVVDRGTAKQGVQESEVLSNVPKEFSLSQNYPNPFNPETMIQFGLPVANEIRLMIYDMQGRVVRRWFENVLPAGHHTIRWDGNDASGAPVASGVYLYRLQAGGFTQVKKMSLVR